MKLFQTQRDFSLVLFSALFGFLLANIFGTFLTALRNYVKWDGFIIFGLVVCIECINLIVHKVVKSVDVPPLHGSLDVGNLFQRSFRFVISNGFKLATFSTIATPLVSKREGKQSEKPFHSSPRQKKRFLMYQLINSFKLGILLGFFVEAFKVGS